MRFSILVLALLPLLASCQRPETKRTADADRFVQPEAEAQLSAAPERRVAITFDDLPVARGRHHEGSLQQITTSLLSHLVSAGIPAIGFVNESKFGSGEDREVRVALLEQWLNAGMELGNHTYSHVSFWKTPLEEYKADVLRGERVMRRLLAQRNQRPRYFRHPYLNTGPSLEAKEAFERFLSDHGYEVAPVTIDNMDVMYALAYDNAADAGDRVLMRRIGEAYVEHLRDSFAYFEDLSKTLLGREPAQILMLHANPLNADYMDEVAAMIRERGYSFIPIDQALDDPAYDLPDRYIGPRGHSWLQRWAITQGMDPGSEPRAPEWLEQVAYP